MSIYSEKFVKRSQKVRRCVGCDNFATINVGDPYWSCFFADDGEAGSYAVCDPCRTHIRSCKECQQRCAEGEPRWVHEHRKEVEQESAAVAA